MEKTKKETKTSTLGDKSKAPNNIQSKKTSSKKHIKAVKNDNKITLTKTKYIKGGNNRSSGEPAVSAKYGNVGNTATGQDGRKYVIKKVNNEQVWELKYSEPTLLAKYANVGNTATGQDGRKYIVKSINNEHVWRPKYSEPAFLAKYANVGNTATGEDGKKYVAIKSNNKNEWRRLC